MNIIFQCPHICFVQSVVSVGAFDGVHLAHNSLIKTVKEISTNNKFKSIVFTFEELPKNFFSKKKSKVITTNNEKIKILKAKEIDTVIFRKFDNNFANYSAEEFIKEVLINKLNMHTLVIGDDHKLGKNQQGDFEYLKKLSVKYNFNVVQIASYFVDDKRVSSTSIRNALNVGDIELANLQLGYNYFLSGKIVKGKQIGRKIGFPTANIKVSEDKLLPKDGVYSVITVIDGKKYFGMCNIGYRPSINFSKEKTIEVHIVNFDKNIYNQEITLHFSTKIRDEIKFNNVPELIRQLKKDKIFTINYFSK